MSDRQPPAIWLAALAGVLCALILVSPANAKALPFPGNIEDGLDEDHRLTEPSGIVYHGGRGTLFVAGDEGDLSEVSLDGVVLHQRRLILDNPSDFEGITWAPTTGMLYVLVEMTDAILEVNPDDLLVRRAFSVSRTWMGETVIAEGGQGLEGITFVEDADDAHGGTFYIVNQGFEDSASDDASAILQVRVPLRDDVDDVEVPIVRHMRLDVFNASAIHYDANSAALYLLSQGTLCRASMDGEIDATYKTPGDEPEGLTFDGAGDMYFVRDAGGLVRASVDGLFRAP